MDFRLIVLAVSIVWIVSECLLAVFRRSTSTGAKPKGSSVLWLNVIIYGSVASGVWISLTGPGMMAVSHFFPFCGLMLMLTGFAIRWTAILTLREYFTVDVAIQNEQRVVQNGIYRYIRHPAYAGLMMSFLGLGVALNNWITVLVIMVPVGAAFIKRISIEEQALFEGLGDEYRQYSHTTRRLIPGIF